MAKDHSDLYLDAIYHLQHLESPVSTSALAEQLGVSPASVSEMMRKLTEQGLLRYTPRRGVTLTDEGEQRALLLVRKHRLWEVFLFEYLKLDWEQIYEEACQLEHATSPLVAARLEEFLGHPTACPHGSAVPNAGGALPDIPTVRLSDLKASQEGVLNSILERRPEVLEYLTQAGMRPGTQVKVIERAPCEGPIMVQVGDTVKALSLELADRILIEL